MPATIRFDPDAANGNFNTGANWIGGVKPGAADSFIIDGTPDTPLEMNIDDGLDQSAVTFANGILGPNYRGQFGLSTTAPFKGNFSGVMSIVGGAAENYIQGTIADLRFNGCGLDKYGELWALGAIAKATVLRGILWGWSGTWGEAHIVAPAGSSGAQLKIMDADIATLYGFNGIAGIESDSTAGRIRQLINASANVSILAGQLDAATIAGGRVAVESLTAISGAVLVHGGEFALTNVQAQTVARLEVYPSGIIRVNQGIDNDILTVYANHGGQRIDGALAA